ncbi:MAG: lysophospholipid acyltransferase family protein [Candidatus Margulisiibacteriota bacterium]
MNRFFVGEVRGIENIPEDRPAILAANHQSYFDFLIIPSVVKSRRVHIIAARELSAHPFVGIYARNDKCILVDRKTPGTKFYKDAIKVLKDNNLLLIFPEGTRSPDGSISSFKRGFVELARIAGAVIVPTAINGTKDILPKGGKKIKLNKSSIAFGKPVDVNDLIPVNAGKKMLQQISEEIRQTVTELIK